MVYCDLRKNVCTTQAVTDLAAHRKTQKNWITDGRARPADGEHVFSTGAVDVY